MADTVKVSFKVFNEDFKKAMGEMKSETTQLNREFKLQKAQLKSTGSETDKLKAQVDYLSKRYENASERVKTTKEQLNKAKQVYGENSNEVKKLEGELTNAKIQEQNFANELKSATDNLQKQQDPLLKTSKKLEDMGEKLKKVGGGLKTAGDNMTKWVTGPMVGAAGAIYGLTKKSGDYADRILDLNAITGMSTDSIQEWQHVATVAGVGTESMTKAVEGLTRRIPQLESGTGRAAEQLQQLGIKYEDLSAMSPDQQFDLLIGKMSEMDNVTERNKIGAQLFGGAWTELAPVLSMGSEQIAATREEAHQMGTVMGEDGLNEANNFRIEMDKLKSSFEGFAMQIGSDMAPVLREDLLPLVKESVVPAIKDFIEKIKDVIKWFGDLSPETQEMIVKLAGLLAMTGPVISIFGRLTGGIGGVFGAGSKLIKNWDKIKKTGKILAGGLKGGIGFLFSPAGMIMLGIAAVIAIGVALYKNWDTIKAKASELWNKLKGVFDSIKKGVGDKMESAKNKVRDAIDKIKGFFDFNWSLPKLKMPSVSITGKFSLLPPKVPKFSLNWKSEGAIFKRPTALGGIGVGDAYNGLGSSPEVVAPMSRLIDIISSVVKRNQVQPQAVASGTIQVVSPVYLNGKEIARVITPDVGIELEKEKNRRRR